MGKSIINYANLFGSLKCKIKQHVNEDIKINTQGFDEQIQEKISKQILDSLNELKAKLKNDTSLVDDLASYVNDKISSICNSLNSLTKSIKTDMDDEEFKYLMDNTIKTKLESVYNELGLYIEISDELQNQFDDIMFNNSIKSNDVAIKIKSIMNTLMSNDISVYDRNIINNKNLTIDKIIDPLINQLTEI